MEAKEDTDQPFSQTISGNPITGTDTVTFTNLTPGAKYTIVGTLKFANNFEITNSLTPLVVTTTTLAEVVEDARLNVGAIVGIVIGSIAGAALLGAGGY